MTGRWLSAAFLVSCCLHGAEAAQERTRIGRAFDANSGVLLYEERHVETLIDGEVISDQVRYVDPQGRTFATKRVDFQLHPLVPEFALANRTTGHLETLRRADASSVEVRCREQADGAVRTERVVSPKHALADAGFDRFIESSWDALMAGARPVRQFLVPCRLEFVGFRFRRVDDGGDPGQVRFAMEIDSAVLRLLVAGITVVYDRASRRLLHYEGLSNIRDGNGDNYDVRIEFHYPSARHPGAPDTTARGTTKPVSVIGGSG